MMKEAFLKALMPVTIITFMAICALAPLYVGLSVISTKVHQNSQ